ncbi:MAG: type I-G CRISPR-associated protein Cas8g2 [Opitutaceae bacterium]
MPDASIPVDLLNPGQVFASLGFLEAADVLLGDAEGGFDWADEANVRFQLRTKGNKNPFAQVLAFLNEANPFAISPLEDVKERDGTETRIQPGLHPCRIRDDKGRLRHALLPIEISTANATLRFDYWADLDSGRPILRLWTATNGNSASIRLSKVHRSLREAFSANPHLFMNPFNEPSPVEANFRLELRRNWTALGAGFSPDKQNKSSTCVPIQVSTYPVVEMLAALALSNARPVPTASELKWGYAAWCGLLLPELARAAVSQAFLCTKDRRFWMFLEKPNDGGDLSIAYATQDKETHA